MRTLFLNPPSFEGFDGGAGSRWPASREIESYWYPVWLCYPAGMLEDSKVVDAPPHNISIEQTVAMANDFELLVLFTSSPGFHVDVKIAEMMKDVNPKMKVAFVGPPVTIEPEKSLRASQGDRFRGAPRIRSSDRAITPRALRSPSCPASATGKTARSSTIPKAASSRIWTSCRGLRKSTSATWISAATTFRFC